MLRGGDVKVFQLERFSQYFRARHFLHNFRARKPLGFTIEGLEIFIEILRVRFVSSKIYMTFLDIECFMLQVV